jgi:hypothetical protein
MNKLAWFALAATTAASAHEGHGLPGASHWHASDVLLPLLLAAAVGLAIWWRGRE